MNFLHLQSKACYRALSSRDPRFDGRFFTGVSSTGIYCRPVCPARTPRRENCRFFACAAAAEEAGFRPCLRCRPETSPGTPAWRGTAATVSRAARLIAGGALDEGGVDELAARLGMGERHLRRLFDEHLGASPVAVAQTRRVQFAKRLLDETTLPMSQVAFASGFGSVRRFNAAMRKVYSRSPSELRRERAPRRRGRAAAHLTLRLPYRPPYHWAGMMAFLGARTTPGVEQIDGDLYRRTVAVGERSGILEVRPMAGESALALRVPVELSDDLVHVVERARWMFDCNAEPREIAAHLRRDPLLKKAVRVRTGLRIPGAWDGFELAVRAILGQQVTVAGATTLAGRLVQAHGEPLPGGEPGLDRLFPTPAVLAKVNPSALGMPRSRGATIQGLARAVRDGEVVLDGSEDPHVVMQRLEAIPGVGDWTAQYIAMRALGESDAFPASDLGVRKALGDGAVLPRVSEVLAGAEAWRPWRAYAAMNLWMEV